MRNKIARRKRKELLSLGCILKKEQFIKEQGWRRKDCGYAIEFDFRGWDWSVCERDKLAAFKAAVQCIREELELGPEHYENLSKLIEMMKTDS